MCKLLFPCYYVAVFINTVLQFVSSLVPDFIIVLFEQERKESRTLICDRLLQFCVPLLCIYFQFFNSLLSPPLLYNFNWYFYQKMLIQGKLAAEINCGELFVMLL